MKLVKQVLLAVLLLLGAVSLAVGVMMKFYGLRFQMDGTGYRPMAYFDHTEDRLKEIEKRSELERADAAPAPGPLVEASASKPDAASDAAPDAAPDSAPAAVPVSAPWPGFYGRLRNGTYTGGAILTSWPEKGLKEAWRRPVGQGYGSMTVAQGLLFTIEQRRDQEVVAAYDAATGKAAWTSSWKALFQESMGGDGPRSTPAWDEGRLYVLGATGEFRCLDAATGALIWRRNILEDNASPNLQWGMAASPLVAGELVLVVGGKGVAAYDKMTGAPRWSALEDSGSYTAPMQVTLDGQPQFLLVMAKRALGLSLDGKEVLWEVPWVTGYDTNSAIPIVVDANHVILTAGYGHGAALLEITKGGAREVWKSQAMKCKFNNAVLHKGVVYGLDEGILAAMDAATGKRLWKGGRYGYGQLLLAGDHVVLLSETGEIALVRATPEKLEEEAKFQAIEGKTWNVPAMAEGRLYVRNGTEMAAYRIAP
ncbi:MAG: PQQ-like beta-propeller repeat protein [Candidatus Solibacter usitatus]|nr:PQQ-like beta-propeller repeat protein [Candidatus Solibacter usitatus]